LCNACVESVVTGHSALRAELFFLRRESDDEFSDGFDDCYLGDVCDCVSEFILPEDFQPTAKVGI
jgi:hypothetical protein